MKLPTLYKGEQEWNCEVVDCGLSSNIIVTFGKTGGKMQTKYTPITKGKNIGRSNETSHYEQAVAEATSKWTKQKDKLYLEKGETSTIFNVRPMLAHSYSDYAHKIVFPCYGQPKLDGIRCLGAAQGMFSRQGKEFKVLAHIFTSLNYWFNLYPGLIFDGELYTQLINFQDIISAVKRDEVSELTSSIEYHVYDIVSSSTYTDRLNTIKNLPDIPNVKRVQTVIIKNADEVDYYHARFVEQGYEGLMLRNMCGLYREDKRSHDLLKVKEFQDGEFKILAFREDKNGHPVFTCVHNNTEFDVKPQGNDKQRKDYLANGSSLLGKMMTVKYFSMTDSDNPVPRFPVGVGIRNYE